MQKRQFKHSVLGEQGAGVLAVRDGGEEFEQQGLGIFHCAGLSEPAVRCVSASMLSTPRGSVVASPPGSNTARMSAMDICGSAAMAPHMRLNGSTNFLLCLLAIVLSYLVWL